MGFANKEIVHLEAKVSKMKQEPDASVAEAEQLAFEVHCVLGLVEEAKKFCDRVTSFETAVCAKKLKGGKSPATKTKRKKTDIKADVERDHVNLEARNARGVKLEACDA